MRPHLGRRGRTRLGVPLFFFPLAGGFFGGLAAHLFDVTFGVVFLMFLFPAFKIIGDPAVNDPVADLELVFEGVTGCHSRRLSLKSESRLDLDDVFSKML